MALRKKHDFVKKIKSMTYSNLKILSLKKSLKIKFGRKISKIIEYVMDFGSWHNHGYCRKPFKIFEKSFVVNAFERKIFGT